MNVDTAHDLKRVGEPDAKSDSEPGQPGFVPNNVPIQSTIQSTLRDTEGSDDDDDNSQACAEAAQSTRDCDGSDDDDDVPPPHNQAAQPVVGHNNAQNIHNHNNTHSARNAAVLLCFIAIIARMLWPQPQPPPPPPPPLCSQVPSVRPKFECPKCDAYKHDVCIMYAPLSAEEFIIDGKASDGSLNGYPCTSFTWEFTENHFVSSAVPNSSRLHIITPDEHDARRDSLLLSIAMEIRDQHTGELKWTTVTDCAMEVLFYKAPFIGIDLGTTYSCAAYQRPEVNATSNKRDAEVVLLDAAVGEYCVPSAVYFSGTRQRVYVGHTAKKMAIADNNLQNYVYDVKRIIGRVSTDPFLAAFNATHTFALNLQGTYPQIAIANWPGLPAVTADQIQAVILRHVAMAASKKFGVANVRDVVVSIPAIFHDRQRKAVHTACAIADLRCRLLVVEPSAAGIAHVYYAQDAADVKLYQSYFMTLDSGGGTTDITILRCVGFHCEVLGVAGDAELGGVDFDAVIVELVVEKVLAHRDVHFADKDDLVEHQAALYDEIVCKAELIKKALTADDAYLVRLQYEQRYLSVSIARREFESHPRTQALLQRVIALAHEAMTDDSFAAKMGSEHLTSVKAILLIGGTVKIPLLQAKLREAFVRETAPQTRLIYPETHDPQLMVVIGAAVIGGSMSYTAATNRDILQFQVPNAPVVDNVIPMAFGFEVCVADPSEPSGHRCGVMDALVARSSKYPVTGDGIYCQKDQLSTTATLSLYEGDAQMVKDCYYLANLEIMHVPQRLHNECNNIKVTLGIDENGIANITAQVKDGETYSMEVPVISHDGHLDESEINVLRQQVLSWCA